MSLHLVIVDGSRYGQTTKIVHRIAERVRQEGIAADVVPVSGTMPALDRFDAIVIAAPVFFGHHRRKAERFIRKHLASLCLVPNALVSVSNAAGGDRAVAESYVHDLVRRTGWLPDTFALVAGADSLTKQGWLTRMITLREAKNRGRDEVPTRDYEFTRWDEVEQFARDFAHRLISKATPETHAPTLSGAGL